MINALFILYITYIVETIRVFANKIYIMPFCSLVFFLVCLTDVFLSISSNLISRYKNDYFSLLLEGVLYDVQIYFIRYSLFPFHNISFWRGKKSTVDPWISVSVV